MPKAPRVPECHPDRKHQAFGLCLRCYLARYQSIHRPRKYERPRMAECHPVRKHAALGLCRSCYAHKQRQDNPELVRARVRRSKLHHLAEFYGISEDERKTAVCCICLMNVNGDEGDSMTVDHDHNTGEFRGFLCHRCNTGLGHFQDSVELLERAIFYLQGSAPG
jgi:hypothetical protein